MFKKQIDELTKAVLSPAKFAREDPTTQGRKLFKYGMELNKEACRSLLRLALVADVLDGDALEERAAALHERFVELFEDEAKSWPTRNDEPVSPFTGNTPPDDET